MNLLQVGYVFSQNNNKDIIFKMWILIDTCSTATFRNNRELVMNVQARDKYNVPEFFYKWWVTTLRGEMHPKITPNKCAHEHKTNVNHFSFKGCSIHNRSEHNHVYGKHKSHSITL